jgi:hypothetical protein
MPQYEYSVVPAPKQVPKIKGVKGTPQRFAQGMTDLLNAWGAEGWEFQRVETLPCEERSGLMGKTLGSQVVLVFRREIEEAGPEAYAETAPTPEELARDLPPGAAPAAGAEAAPRAAEPGDAGDADAKPAAAPRLTASRAAPDRLRPLPGTMDRRKG